MSTLLDDLRAALSERYVVERELGRGGMATVFVADDPKHGRRVAIKVLSPEIASVMSADRFLREIQIAARLSHPHILPVFDSGNANGLLYYVMPLVEGESLRDRMTREQQLSVDDAVQLTCEVADALQYAHDHGVVHRDIKPENVLLQGGHAVVADFGIARMVDEGAAQKLTATGVSVGTAHYMSPEQFVGEHVDGRADLYSLACMLYEMLVGEVPFTGPNAMAVIARATMELPSSIRIVRGTVPEEIEDAVMRALEKVPADRFASVKQFKEALLGQAGTSNYIRPTMRHTAARMARQTPPGAAGESRWSRRRVALVAAVSTAIVIAGAGAWRMEAARGGFGVRQAGGAIGGYGAENVAVLYFDADSTTRPLADGITEGLIRQLSQVSALNVASRNNVARLRGSDASVDSIASALHVGLVVKGSVERAGGKVKVAVRLVDQSGAPVAGTSIERPASDAVQLQGEVAREVARFLQQQIGKEVQLRDERAQTTSTEAYLLLQRAEQQRRAGDSLIAAGNGAAAVATFGRADTLLLQAAKLDAEWPAIPAARARVAYRRAVALRGSPAGTLVPVVDSGVAFANAALALDERDADAYELRGELTYLRYTQHLIADSRQADAALDAAEKDLLRATSLSANQAGAWETLSRLYYSRKLVTQANNAAQQAYRSDAYLQNAPDILMRLFWTSYDLGEFPSADKWCREGRRRFPQSTSFVECRLWLLGTKYAGSPEPGDAWRLFDSLQAITPPARAKAEGAYGRILVAGAIAQAWRADTTRRALRDSADHVLLAARVGRDVDPALEFTGYEAVVRVVLREYDTALDLIEHYLTVKPEHRSGFKTNASQWWTDLKDLPRFQRLIAGVQ